MSRRNKTTWSIRSVATTARTDPSVDVVVVGIEVVIVGDEAEVLVKEIRDVIRDRHRTEHNHKDKRRC